VRLRESKLSKLRCATCGSAIWHRFQRESVQHSAQGPPKTAGQREGVTAPFAYSMSRMYVGQRRGKEEDRRAVQGAGHRDQISAKVVELLTQCGNRSHSKHKKSVSYQTLIIT
jgi:hypothetical protein